MLSDEIIRGEKSEFSGYSYRTTFFNKRIIVSQMAQVYQRSLLPGDFRVEEFSQFDGYTDSVDEIQLLTISSERFGIRGLIINGFEINPGDLSNAFVHSLLTSKLA